MVSQLFEFHLEASGLPVRVKGCLTILCSIRSIFLFMYFFLTPVFLSSLLWCFRCFWAVGCRLRRSREERLHGELQLSHRLHSPHRPGPPRPNGSDSSSPPVMLLPPPVRRSSGLVPPAAQLPSVPALPGVRTHPFIPAEAPPPVHRCGRCQLPVGAWGGGETGEPVLRAQRGRLLDSSGVLPRTLRQGRGPDGRDKLRPDIHLQQPPPRLPAPPPLPPLILLPPHLPFLLLLFLLLKVFLSVGQPRPSRWFCFHGNRKLSSSRCSSRKCLLPTPAHLQPLPVHLLLLSGSEVGSRPLPMRLQLLRLSRKLRHLQRAARLRCRQLPAAIFIWLLPLHPGSSAPPHAPRVLLQRRRLRSPAFFLPHDGAPTRLPS